MPHSRATIHTYMCVDVFSRACITAHLLLMAERDALKVNSLFKSSTCISTIAVQSDVMGGLAFICTVFVKGTVNLESRNDLEHKS